AEPDICGWYISIPQQGYELRVQCMLMNASEAIGIEHLKLDDQAHIWTTMVSAKKPFLKSLFGGLNTEAEETKLTQTITAILQMEPSLNTFPEPEFEFGD
ncbi:MAG: hypothetical protein ACKO1L_11255, partial [Brachymonas sp.]